MSEYIPGINQNLTYSEYVPVDGITIVSDDALNTIGVGIIGNVNISDVDASKITGDIIGEIPLDEKNIIEEDGKITLNLDLNIDNATLSEDLVVGGDFIVNGSFVHLNTGEINLKDNIIKINSENPSDITDAGWVCQFVSESKNKYSGMIRKASDGKFYLVMNATDDADPISTGVYADLNLGKLITTDDINCGSNLVFDSTTTRIYKSDDTGSMLIYSGAVDTSSNIEMYGSTHATQANNCFIDTNKVEFRSVVGSQRFKIDDSEMTTFKNLIPNVDNTLNLGTVARHFNGLCVGTVCATDGLTSATFTNTAITTPGDYLLDVGGNTLTLESSITKYKSDSHRFNLEDGTQLIRIEEDTLYPLETDIFNLGSSAYRFGNIWGDSIISRSATLSTVSATLATFSSINGDLIPLAGSDRMLGSATYPWHTVRSSNYYVADQTLEEYINTVAEGFDQSLNTSDDVAFNSLSLTTPYNPFDQSLNSTNTAEFAGLILTNDLIPSGTVNIGNSTNRFSRGYFDKINLGSDLNRDDSKIMLSINNDGNEALPAFTISSSEYSTAGLCLTAGDYSNDQANAHSSVFWSENDNIAEGTGRYGAELCYWGRSEGTISGRSKQSDEGSEYLHLRTYQNSNSGRTCIMWHRNSSASIFKGIIYQRDEGNSYYSHEWHRPKESRDGWKQEAGIRIIGETNQAYDHIIKTYGFTDSSYSDFLYKWTSNSANDDIDEVDVFGFRRNEDADPIMYMPHIEPWSSGTYDIGSSTAKFENGYINNLYSETLTITSGIACNGNIIPSSDSTYDLGEAGTAFRDLYCDKFRCPNAIHYFYFGDTDATLWLQPSTWAGTETMKIALGDSTHYLKCDREEGISLISYDGITIGAGDNTLIYGDEIQTTGDIVPTDDSKYNLGSTSKRFDVVHTDEVEIGGIAELDSYGLHFPDNHTNYKFYPNTMFEGVALGGTTIGYKIMRVGDIQGAYLEFPQDMDADGSFIIYVFASSYTSSSNTETWAFEVALTGISAGDNDGHSLSPALPDLVSGTFNAGTTYTVYKDTILKITSPFSTIDNLLYAKITRVGSDTDPTNIGFIGMGIKYTRAINNCDISW